MRPVDIPEKIDVSRRSALVGAGLGVATLTSLGVAGLTASPTAAAKASSPVPTNPTQALERLMDGNARYIAGKAIGPNRGSDRRKETESEGQSPYAAIISCADSRVAPEILFDEGVGDLFVMRVAGNIVDPLILGSLEFGVAVLGCKTIMVLGHEECGAVKAAMDVAAGGDKLPGSIQALADKIGPYVKGIDKKKVPQAIRVNARETVKEILAKSSIINDAVKAGKANIVAAYYDLDEGRVTMVPA